MADELKRVRNVKPLWSRLGTRLGVMLGGIDMWLNTIFPFLSHTLKHSKPDYASLEKAAKAEQIDYPKPDGLLSFDILSSVFLSGTNHAEDQPVHLKLSPEHPNRRDPAGICGARTAILPGAGLRGGRRGRQAEVSDQRAELRPLQNLRREGPGPEHYLGAS